MANWLERDNQKKTAKEGVPGFTRQEVNRPPGIAQQIYWKEQAMGGKPTTAPYQHAVQQGAHVSNLQHGYSPAQQTAEAVFDRSQLAGALVPAEKFQLETSEFDDIVNWVKQTSKPNSAPDSAHGSVPSPGHLQKRDGALQDRLAKKEGQKWSEFFASKEYLESVNIK